MRSRASSLLFALLTAAAQAEPVVRTTRWRELDAYELSDGRSVAIVVPALGGRLVHYGLKDGPNWLWTGAPGRERKPDAQFWGGDKTYIGPHTLWRQYLPRAWPPPEPDRTAHRAELLAGARLRTTGEAWPGYGATIEREYDWDAENGDLVIHHRITPVAGSGMLGCVWVITQIAPVPEVYVPLASSSPYRDGWFEFDFGSGKARACATPATATLLRLAPRVGAGWKMGAHPPQPALAAVREGFAFVQRSDPQKGDYPEGVDGAGLSVEVYHHSAAPPDQYLELELLSPLRRLDQGATLTTRWNIHALPQGEVIPGLERLLK